MTDTPDYAPIYARLRALLGNKLPKANFEAARSLIEVSGNSQQECARLFSIAIGVPVVKAGKTMSHYGKVLLKRLEGVRLVAYRDSAGIPTIGYGNTYHPDGTPVKMGDTISQSQAESYLDAVIVKYETAVNKIITVPLSQNQFDALVCFVYNIGTTGFLNSTVDDKLNAGDVQAALTTWKSYNKARVGGELTVIQGLVNRRQAEISHFLS